MSLPRIRIHSDKRFANEQLEKMHFFPRCELFACGKFRAVGYFLLIFADIIFVDKHVESFFHNTQKARVSECVAENVLTHAHILKTPLATLEDRWNSAELGCGTEW